MKPNPTFTLTQLKDYIRSKKLNHPDVKLTMKKADMIAGLKKAGHWEEKSKLNPAPKKTIKKEKPAPKKSTPKPAPKKPTPKKPPTPKPAPKPATPKPATPKPAPKPAPKKPTPKPAPKPKTGLSSQKISFAITDIKEKVEKEIIKWVKENANLSENDYKKMIIKFIQKNFVDKAYDILEPNETNLSVAEYNKIEEFISNLRSDLRDFADNRFKPPTPKPPTPKQPTPKTKSKTYPIREWKANLNDSVDKMVSQLEEGGWVVSKGQKNHIKKILNKKPKYLQLKTIYGRTTPDFSQKTKLQIVNIFETKPKYKKYDPIKVKDSETGFNTLMDQDEKYKDDPEFKKWKEENDEVKTFSVKQLNLKQK
jgi:hypothetical protein